MGNSKSKTTPLPSKRRPSAAEIILNDLQLSSPQSPNQLVHTLSVIHNYAVKYKTPAERVKAAHKLYKRDILDKHGDSESTLDFSMDTIESFMEEQMALGLTEEEKTLLYKTIAYERVIEKREVDKWKIMGTFFKLVMGYVDMGTDFATLNMYLTINPLIALVQGIVLAFSFLCQGVSSVALGQPYWVGLVGFMGMKPMLEWWRDAFEEPPFVGQVFDNGGMMWISRMTEMSKLFELFSSSSVII